VNFIGHEAHRRLNFQRGELSFKAIAASESTVSVLRKLMDRLEQLWQQLLSHITVIHPTMGVTQIALKARVTQDVLRKIQEVHG
jgi:hypothetical protein